MAVQEDSNAGAMLCAPRHADCEARQKGLTHIDGNYTRHDEVAAKLPATSSDTRRPGHPLGR